MNAIATDPVTKLPTSLKPLQKVASASASDTFPVSALKPLAKAGEKLNVASMLEPLVSDGLMRSEDALLISSQSSVLTSQHALVSIAQRKLMSPSTGRILDLDTLTEWAAKRSQIPFFRIEPLKVNFSRLADFMSNQYASRFKILPLDLRGSELWIGTAEPFDTSWLAEFASATRKQIQLVMVNPTELTRYIGEFYSLAQSVRAAKNSSNVSSNQNFEQLVELGKSGKNFDANDSHIVGITEWLWQYAFEQGASDIHLEPRRDTGSVRFRIDGVLHRVYQVPATVMTAMTSRIKLLGRMDIIERRRPQDGRIKTRMPNGEEVELRLSTMPTAFGEKLVMRIFDPGVLMRDFGELGFSNEELSTWQRWTQRPNGIILVTGPTGSGKTTTLYTTLKTLATDEVNVSTVEDPIEMIEPSFNQMQVQENIELGFADGVRALMRQDPDIIMVGEIRDKPTADMTIQAALTGHLVLSTLHTNDAPSALSRLVDLGVPHFMLNATLVGVLGQRLIRKLCEACKQPDEDFSDEAWSTLIRPFKAPRPKGVYRPVGCVTCRMTGYKGRVGIYEMLEIDSVMRETLAINTNLDSLKQAALKQGWKPLRLSGASKVQQGLTTIEEVVKAAPLMD
jgi:general secretion pathway protein E